MRVRLIRIGNSRGIRIPKPIIEHCRFVDTVQVRVERGCLVIAPERPPRQGWEEGFRAAGDELLLETLPPDQFDREEWRW